MYTQNVYIQYYYLASSVDWYNVFIFITNFEFIKLLYTQVLQVRSPTKLYEMYMGWLINENYYINF